MIDDTKWSEWKVHTGGPADFLKGEEWEAQHLGAEDQIGNLTELEYATPDRPALYRVKIKLREVQPFAIVFNSKGKLIATWAKTMSDTEWKKLVINEAATRGRMAVFYGTDGHPTGERHDFTEKAL